MRRIKVMSLSNCKKITYPAKQQPKKPKRCQFSIELEISWRELKMTDEYKFIRDVAALFTADSLGPKK